MYFFVICHFAFWRTKFGEIDSMWLVTFRKWYEMVVFGMKCWHKRQKKDVRRKDAKSDKNFQKN